MTSFFPKTNIPFFTLTLGFDGFWYCDLFFPSLIYLLTITGRALNRFHNRSKLLKLVLRSMQSIQKVEEVLKSCIYVYQLLKVFVYFCVYVWVWKSLNRSKKVLKNAFKRCSNTRNRQKRLHFRNELSKQKIIAAKTISASLSSQICNSCLQTQRI